MEKNSLIKKVKNMTIKNNQINSNFHQIAVTDVNGQVTAIEAGGVVLADAANLTIGGGSNGQVLATDGAGNLSFTSNVANAGYAAVSNVAYSVSGANVSGTVANATFATSAGSATVSDSANAVTGANVSGQVANAASADVALSVAGANVSGTVSLATTANVANSVSRGNVSGAGNIGQLQFANAAGNLTSSDRYYIGANGTGALNISRDGAATGFSTAVYSNVSGPHSVSAKARGTKASPLPAQVGDRAFGMVGTIYTGNGVSSWDNIPGWATTANVPGIFFDVTELPTSSTTQYGAKMSVKVSNAQSNLNHFMNFNDNGQLETPKLRVSIPNIPASATATGKYGEIAFDNDYVYICVNTNTWKRSALTTW